MMRRFSIVLVLAVVLLGCKTHEKVLTPGTEPFVYSHYFTQGIQRLLFKTRLQLAKEEFSGLLVVKETAPQEYRSIFTTETGFKVFDFTIRNTGYAVNYGVGPIEKKFIAIRLAYTIQALLLRPLPTAPVVLKVGDEESGRFTVEKYGYALRKKGPRVHTQTVYFKNKRKAEARFSAFGTDDVPDSVAVTSFGFPLTASFHFLKQ